MNFSLEEFDHLIAQAEEAAAGFDGRALGKAMGALQSYMEDTASKLPQDAHTLEHMRTRLRRYQGLCQFLQNTLKSALMGALKGEATLSYGPCAGRRAHRPSATPHGATTHHLAPLIRRYC